MTVGSLFSGIGGLDLGLERAGMEIKWQVENDPYCRKVLKKHWPDVDLYGDIKEVTELPYVDLICGGFPCQPVSLANSKRKGVSDERWLWPEFSRIIRILRPRYALVENVPGLLSAGFGGVLGDLATLGYNAEWESIPAAYVGAPHLRRRIFILGYTDFPGEPTSAIDVEAPRVPKVANSPSARRGKAGRIFTSKTNRRGTLGELGGSGWWEVEPAMDRVANGLPGQLDRLRALGKRRRPASRRVDRAKDNGEP